MSSFRVRLYHYLDQRGSLGGLLPFKKCRGSVLAFALAICLGFLASWQFLLLLTYIHLMRQRDSLETFSMSGTNFTYSKFWPELPEGPKRSKRYRKFKAYTARSFQKIAKVYQQSRFQCASIFAGDKKRVQRAVGISIVLARLEQIAHGESDKVPQSPVGTPSKKLFREVSSWPRWEFQRPSNAWYLKATQNCQKFRHSRGYITSPLSHEEESFPIAFSILAYKDVEMVERLLRMIYRPQNSYCIHVDQNAEEEFYTTVSAIADCFPDNVRMASARIPVEWGTYSTVEPELVCMNNLWDMDEELYGDAIESAEKAASGKRRHRIISRPKVKVTEKTRRKSRWKYFINLTGQEFPLKTNYELVKILKAFNGANNEEGTLVRAEKMRWRQAPKPPHGINAFKGSVHTIINRATVDFIIHDPRSFDFLEWLRDTKFPDETIFASINYNPLLGIPGTYNGEDMESVTPFARYKKWNLNHDYRACHSKLIVRDVCILSTADLRDMGLSPHLFGNKFYLHKDRVVIGCLEELLFNNTRDEFFGNLTFNASFYAHQDFVLNQIKPKKS